MKTTILTTFTLAVLVMENAWAGGGAVPEIDAGSGALALGLTAGIVALIRERRRRK